MEKIDTPSPKCTNSVVLYSTICHIRICVHPDLPICEHISEQSLCVSYCSSWGEEVNVETVDVRVPGMLFACLVCLFWAGNVTLTWSSPLSPWNPALNFQMSADLSLLVPLSTYSLCLYFDGARSLVTLGLYCSCYLHG